VSIDKVLLIWIPSRRGKGMAKSFPVGLLYVGRILEDLGIDVSIYDIYQHAFDPKNSDKFCSGKVLEVISKIKPKIVGFGGIASSYGWTKVLSNKIKQDFSGIMQIAGGALSSTYALLLTKSAIDIVFHGETESNLPIFIKKLNKGENVYDVPGISYLAKNGITKNAPQRQIKNLDDIPFPAYHLVDIKRYLSQDVPFSERFLRHYRNDLKYQGHYDEIKRKLDGVDALFPVVTARGCTHRCSFCYRHMKGYRRHSIDYVIRHVKYINEQFNVFGISFYDELFNGDMQWVFSLCDAIEKSGLKIAYKTSARADKVSKKLLMRMSETGCFNLEFGQESGSDKILKEYKKGITRRQNIETTLLVRECGIYSAVQLVIGSPGETRDTIRETIDFLQEVGARTYSLNYLLPFPGAPIWKHVEQNNLIDDVEDYLDQVSQKGGGPIVNLTNMPSKEWRNWTKYIRFELDRRRAIVREDSILFVKAFIKYYLQRILPDSLNNKLKVVVKYLLEKRCSSEVI